MNLPDQHYPQELKDAEQGLVRHRRGEPKDPTAPPPTCQTGLALSGGGIRSATFSLGVLQALAKAGLLRRFDYLSTVSGGGYIGSFLGSLYARKDASADVASCQNQVEDLLTDNNSPSIRWLRENGRYLTPNGAGDVLYATSYLLRNWISVLVVMALLALSVFLTADLGGLLFANDFYLKSLPPWLRDLLPVKLANLTSASDYWRSPAWSGTWMWWSPWLGAPLVTLVLWALPAGWAYWLVPPEHDPSRKQWISYIPITSTVFLIPMGILDAFFLPALVLPTSPENQDQIVNELPRLLLTIPPSVLSAVCTLAALFHFLPLRANSEPIAERRRRTSSWLTAGVTITGILLGAALIDSMGRTVYAVWSYDPYHGITLWLGLGLAGVIAAFAGIQRFLPLLMPSGKKRGSAPMGLILGATALVLHLSLLSVVAAVGHGICWNFQQPPRVEVAHQTLTPGERILNQSQNLSAPLIPGSPVTAAVMLTISKPIDREARPDWKTQDYQSWVACLVALGVATALSLSFLWVMPFVNNSSLASVYCARLTRSYLGASNPARLAPNNNAGITDVLPSDDLATDARNANPKETTPGAAPTDGYHPEDRGGPLHLINITINETYEKRSHLQQQDRHGLALAFGPAGISVGARHHSRWNGGGLDTLNVTKGYQVLPTSGFTPELPSLGQLISISGAAFSTGLGAQTSLAISLLCGFFNVRTGYWWDTGIKSKGLLPCVQSFLLHEWLARFPGTSWRHWYLSDGGHFENLACYELIRRRLPFILCCDNGADPDYEFEDIGNLVRKARLDFGAEITFLDSPALADKNLTGYGFGFLGPLDALRRRDSLGDNDQEGLSQACASLANIRYADGSTGILLVIKPGLLGDEPADVGHYHHAHPAFPHEPTIDQFFDEAQWESYRKLGEHCATKCIPYLIRLNGTHFTSVSA